MGGDSKKATNNIFVYFLIKDPSPPHTEDPETGRTWMKFPTELEAVFSALLQLLPGYL